MCGRYILGDSSWAAYHEALSIIKPVDAGTISYNIKPTQDVHIAYATEAGPVADAARWWFVPHWHKGDVKDWKATTFNARMETAHEKPVFRAAWKHQRCIIPASGYFEWTGEKGKKQPWFIAPDQNLPVFFFAGLYSTRTSGQTTCTILTREASSEIKDLHPRMPVILTSDQLTPWMANDVTDAEIIDTFGTTQTYKFHRVAKFGIKDDGPELIDTDDLF
jgi:putative SOS response-associated peptidase YedK